MEQKINLYFINKGQLVTYKKVKRAMMREMISHSKIEEDQNKESKETENSKETEKNKERKKKL